MNKNYTIIFTISVLLFFFTSVSPISAITQAEKDVLIQQIMQQIAALQAQLNQMIAQQQGGQSGNWCYDFNVNLKIGDSGSEILALNNALSKEGLIVDTIYPANNYFSEKTKLAVIAFQNKYASEVLTPAKLTNGTGFVGASTRKKLNTLYSCSRPSISIIYPNGGESVQVGDTVRITWNSIGFSDADNVSIIAYMPSSPYLNVKTLTTYVKVNQGYYDWNISANTLPSTSYPINLKVKIESVKEKAYSSSASAFTVNSTTDSQTGISLAYPNGGQVLYVGDSARITWTSKGLSSSDKIIVSVYASTNPYANVKILTSSAVATQGYYDWNILANTLPSTSYPLNLRAKVEVAGKNISASSASDFTVNSATAQGYASISIIYPNGGENVRVGDTPRVTWTTTGFTPTDMVSIIAYMPSNPYLNVIKITNSVRATQGFYDWGITKYNFPFKDYPVILKVKIESQSKNISAFSASAFTVNAPPEPSPSP